MPGPSCEVEVANRLGRCGGMRTDVLDHGYVAYVEHWGSDERVIEAARMSTDKGFQGWGPLCATCGNAEWSITVPGHYIHVGDSESYLHARDKYGADPVCTKCGGIDVKIGDEKLLRYLWENNHATPFEMAGAIVEVQAPIFVFREWHRHRTQSYNELSARYTPLPDVNYIPTVERLMLGSDGKNKQAGTVKGAAVLTEENAKLYQHRLQIGYEDAERDYQRALADGVPKELARLIIPVGRYSRMRASANLRNWLGFLTLRQDSKAQWEIRVFADAVHDILVRHFPRTLALFDEKRTK